MRIRIGVSERGGTFYTQGLALKAILEQFTTLPPVEVVESPLGASIENANRLDLGEIEFGFVSAPWVVAAKEGVVPFSHSIDLQTVAPMNLGPNFFVVRADSELHNISDLKGKKVAVGMATGGMVHHAEAVFSAIGLGPLDLERVYVNFADGARMLASGKIDAQYQCPVPNQVMTELSERILVRVLRYEPAQLEAALRFIPSDRLTIMRKGAIHGLEEDIPQLGVLNLLVTHSRVNEDLVRHVVQVIVTQAAELSRLLPLFNELPDLLGIVRAERCAPLEFDTVKLHPGAARFYVEAGYITR